MGLILIAIGGAAGALARYGLSGWIQARTGFFPWGTLAVNALGCLLIGFAVRFLETVSMSADARQGLTIGFLGAFTTFSTFSFEAVALARDGDWARAGGYVVGSVGVGVLAVVAGITAAAILLNARS